MRQFILWALVPFLGVVALLLVGLNGFTQIPTYIADNDSRLIVARNHQASAVVANTAANETMKTAAGPEAKAQSGEEVKRTHKAVLETNAKVDALLTTKQTWAFGVDGRWGYVCQLDTTMIIVMLLATVVGGAFGLLLSLPSPPPSDATPAELKAEPHLTLRQFAKRYIDLITGAGLVGLYPVLQLIYHKSSVLAAGLLPLSQTAFSFTLCAGIGIFFLWGCALGYHKAPAYLT